MRKPQFAAEDVGETTEGDRGIARSPLKERVIGVTSHEFVDPRG